MFVEFWKVLSLFWKSIEFNKDDNSSLILRCNEGGCKKETKWETMYCSKDLGQIMTLQEICIKSVVDNK